jgi:hypothetical protein
LTKKILLSTNPLSRSSVGLSATISGAAPSGEAMMGWKIDVGNR